MLARCRRVFFAVALAAVMLSPAEAQAGCAAGLEQTAFRRAVTDNLHCAARRLRGSACTTPAPPACGAAQLQRIIDLVGGMPSGEAPAGDQRLCQVKALRGAATFVARRMQERQVGSRRQRGSRKAVDLPRCTLPIAQTEAGPLPRLGDRCSYLTDAPAAHLSGAAAQRCLRPALEEIVADVMDLPPVAPNVILIVTDDQHPEGVQLMPHVLELAARGASFSNAFTTTPLCAPSRAGILTGQHATTHGVTANNVFLFDDSSTLATWFQTAGYRTALIGKYMNGYGNMSPAIPPGWDTWQAFAQEPNAFFDYTINEDGTVRSYGSAVSDYSTDVIANKALGFVAADDHPFFLYFTPYAPHAPSTPAPRHQDALAWLPPWRPPSWFEDIADKPNWFRAVATNSLPALLAHDPKILNQRESLLAVDDAVAALSAELERRGLLDNTIFVFTADHGLMWGEHRWTGKQVAYEESIRVPLAISYPLRIPAGTVLDAAALNIDIAPTLTALTGVAAGHAMDGRSLTDLLDGAPDWRTDFLVQHFAGGFVVPPWDAIRTSQYKFVRHPNAIDELYDLVADPFEMNNGALLPANAALVSTLEARLDELLN